MRIVQNDAATRLVAKFALLSRDRKVFFRNKNQGSDDKLAAENVSEIRQGIVAA
jgi:hypothetical protein